jgi:hypothetical protein
VNWRAKFRSSTPVAVEQRHPRDTETHQVLDHRRAEAAGPEDDHARLDQALLDVLPVTLKRRERISPQRGP